MNRCLYCLQPIGEEAGDFHPKCNRVFFENTRTPELAYGLDELHDLARQVVSHSITVPGVQPKLSLAFEDDVRHGVVRLTLVGLWGNFILKPPNPVYPELVENEHATMRMAQAFGINTVPFSLIRLKSGELAYLTRRIDRTRAGKLALEDLCQLTERLTEYKYRGSVEQIARTIRRFSSNPGLDVIRFAEIVLFSWITGNADMHLKNYSMLTNSEAYVGLSPAYDLVATKLIMPQDPEESALTINGKKNRIGLPDFAAFAENAGIPSKSFENLLQRFRRNLPAGIESLGNSFLTEEMKSNYRLLVLNRAGRLGLAFA